MLNTDKNLKLYYSISEVAAMFDVNESLLRFWEKEFPQLNPKKGGRGIRQYRKEDIETVKLIYHLVKERGMTLPGARQRMKDNKEATICYLFSPGLSLYTRHLQAPGEIPWISLFSAHRSHAPMHTCVYRHHN